MVVTGAGIGGLTAALALARRGFRAVVLEQAERLEDTGAGIQLSPNAARILIDLGLEERLRPHVIAPTALRVLGAAGGREIARMPLDGAVRRYGAPYWIIHRGDLQAVLAAAVAKQIDISLRLGLRAEDYAAHANGITVLAHGSAGPTDHRGVAALAADGLWSAARRCLGDTKAPRFSGRIAWRGLIPAAAVAPEFRESMVHLWLGRDAHLVHYPVKAGRLINVVVITDERRRRGSAAPDPDAQGWSEPAGRAELLPRFAAEDWTPSARALIGLPEAWLRWPLYERRPLRRWSRGPLALLGDAAHPMLPFLAQGAAMAIEDAAVAAQCLAQGPDDPAAALRMYSSIRRGRARDVARAAARNGSIYHLGGVAGLLRNAAMRIMGGEHLLGHYDWIYRWQPPAG